MSVDFQALLAIAEKQQASNKGGKFGRGLLLPTYSITRTLFALKACTYFVQKAIYV